MPMDETIHQGVVRKELWFLLLGKNTFTVVTVVVFSSPVPQPLHTHHALLFAPIIITVLDVPKIAVISVFPLMTLMLVSLRQHLELTGTS